MSIHRSTLADEVAAEIELGLIETAKRAAERLRQLDKVAVKLAQEGLVRRLNVDPYDSSHLEVVGVSTARSSLPAFGGLLYGASALGHGLRIARTEILDAWQISRVKVGDIDYYGKDGRMRWQQLVLIYEVLETLLKEEHAQMILLDLPLFISRREEATVSEDAMIAAEWEALESCVNAFWAKHLSEIRPFSPEGVTILSLCTHSATSLFAALFRNPDTSPDPVSSQLGSIIKKDWKVLQQLGQSRLLNRILLPSTRSAAYSYEDLDLDPRWQPRELQYVGILGLFLRARHQTGLWHVQVPGHRTQWSAEALDKLCIDLIRATLHDERSAAPLPLWYAQQLVRFPSELLIAYRECIEKELEPYDRK